MAKMPIILQRSPAQNLRKLAGWATATLAGAALTAGAAQFLNLGIVWVLAAGLVVAMSVLGYAIFWWIRPLLPLRQWRTLTEITDLVNYSPANKESAFMPSPILKREVIRHLSVMGNGCGKWTRTVDDDLAREKFGDIRKAGGIVRFLASCPVHLASTGDPDQVEKAKKNAQSLLKLRAIEKSTKGGKFEIRTYKHLATLRLIIVNDNECIVGHYQEEGIADSLYTPLLVFECNDRNQWGFGHAFRRLFESEWNRAEPPTASDWIEIERLGR